MDHYSVQLMEDITLDSNNQPNSSGKNVKFTKNIKDKGPKPTSTLPPNKLKVEMQTLRMSGESEKQLYDTLKYIYGSSFRLWDTSDFENKTSNLGKQYWMERGNLVIKGIIDYSSRSNTPKTQAQITREFAKSKLESYNFHQSHCTEALLHTNGDLGRAQEVLFSKYYNIEDISRTKLPNDANTKELIERRRDEKEALSSIYGDMFYEKIKDQIWTVQLQLDYLVRNEELEKEIQRVKIREEKQKEREVCRLFSQKKCRFGEKCRFLHQQPEVLKVPEREEPYFTLEIRFPDGCKYPYEAPYFYFYKNNGVYPSIQCLRIARHLHNEALLLSEEGTPSIFSIVSLLEDEYEMKAYLDENREQFLDPNDPLFPKSVEEIENLATHYEVGSTNRRNRKNISMEEIHKENDLIEQNFRKKQDNPRYKKMKEQRRRLPAWSKMGHILEIIHENRVSIISGETGCGKSTQVPQFVLDDWIINRSDAKEHVNIVCTQPRRISAIGVAERVAAERDEHVGNTIGYQIRLETKISNKTRLTFCTTGILLQRLSMNPELTDVSHVIIDEVHERSAESDFLLMLLKGLLSRRPDLKVILMSATLKAEAFSSYFAEAPVLHIPGKTFPVEQIFLEDIFDKTNYVLEENSKFTRKIKGGWEQLQIDLETAELAGQCAAPPKETIQDENLTLTQIVSRYTDQTKQTYKNLYVMDYEKLNFELIETLIEWIAFGEHDYPRTGTILVFLPGFAEIVTLKNRLSDNKSISPKTGKFILVPLHSSLSSEDQNLVFKKTGEGIRKIVLSTNLAETSITIDDCVFVIDSGKMKEVRFNSNQNMESLETCWVSRANAMQRKGRAGRVMPGVCFHLYTSYKFKYNFSAQPVPEILRIPLEPLLLRIQLIHKGRTVDLYKTFEKMLEPPTQDNISDAIKRLQDVGAFNSGYTLTPLGHHLAALPVNVHIGKLILLGAIFCCLDSALTIAACLSHKNPFSIPFEKRHEVDPKKEFATSNSDQLTILKAYKKWLEASKRSSYAGEIFANENYLSVKTLYALADIKYQFLELLVSIGFVPVNLPRRQPSVDKTLEISGYELNVNNDNVKLLQGLLCAALYPNIVKVFTPEKSFRIQSAGAVPIEPKPEELRFQTKHDGFVSIHPSSVNFHTGHFPSPFLVYQEKIKTSKVFVKEVSMVPMLPLVLFSGYELNIELHGDIFIVSLDDNWILFSVESHRVGQLLQKMRIELEKLLEQKMQDPLLNLLNNQNGKKIMQTIVNVVTKE